MAKEEVDMGESVLTYYQTKLKREYKIAFIATFIMTLLIHIYKFVNMLPNHDAILAENIYGSQIRIELGRWALGRACQVSSDFALPWIIGLTSCVFIALTVVVITALFELKNPILIGLIGVLLAASPATTETFFYMYTADGYMMAMFLSALAVYFSRIEQKNPWGWVFSSACICVSCGIYQAYVSFGLLLAVCYFMDVLLQDKYSKQDCIKWVLRQIVIFSVALIVYYII